MSLLDKWKELTRPYDDDDEEDYMSEAEPTESPAQERPRPNPFAGFGSPSAPAGGSSAPSAAQSAPQRLREGKVTRIGMGGGQMQVVLMKPERFETAAEIADHLRSKRAVLLNLEATPKDVVRRLVDFLSGVAYAMDGKVKKVAASIYILTPPNVNLMGDLMDELENTGFYL